MNRRAGLADLATRSERWWEWHSSNLYALPTWTRVAPLVREHAALRDALGCAPSVYACYRFTVKLRENDDALARCIDAVLGSLHDETPGMGAHVAIDASDLPAYANGQRYLSKNGPERTRYSDLDASWGHPRRSSRGGSFGRSISIRRTQSTSRPLSSRHASIEWIRQTARCSL